MPNDKTKSTMRKLPQDKSLRPVARELRRNMTKSERRLWHRIRGKQIHGVTFRRQYIIQRYIVDFYCRPLRLAIEVDGLTHEYPDVTRHDRVRQADLEALGITVLRFTSKDVLRDTDRVVEAIAGWVDEHRGPDSCPSASPPS